MEYALEINGLTKRYKEGFTFDNVNILLPYGCIMGLIGENGAGKSTAVKLIMNLISKDSGTIKIFGAAHNELSKNIKEHIGVVMDESSFSEELNIKNVNSVMKNIYKTWDEEKFYSFTERFSLSKDRIIKKYSRGMKMKLAISVALSHDARLLILDEATSGLDPVVREEILDVFYDFIQNERNSILMSSHIISDLEKICDYITFMHKGKIVFSEEKDMLIEKYGILKCSAKEFESIDKSRIHGYRKNSFGVDALVFKNQFSSGYTVDRANIEDIMLYYTKERV